MQDAPTPAEILEAVSRCLRDVIQPALPAREAFEIRVAANALDLVRRQIESVSQPEKDPDAAEHCRLVALLGREGSLEDLNLSLCRRIAAGEFDPARTDLVEHLWATTLDKLAIDQPTYASYLRALAERGTAS